MKIVWQEGDVTVEEISNYTACGYLSTYVVREAKIGRYHVVDLDNAISLAKQLVEGVRH